MSKGMTISTSQECPLLFLVFVWLILWFLSSLSLMFLQVAIGLSIFIGFIGGASAGIILFLFGCVKPIGEKIRKWFLFISSVVLITAVIFIFRYLLSQTSGRLALIFVISTLNIMLLTAAEVFFLGHADDRK